MVRFVSLSDSPTQTSDRMASFERELPFVSSDESKSKTRPGNIDAANSASLAHIGRRQWKYAPSVEDDLASEAECFRVQL